MISHWRSHILLEPNSTSCLQYKFAANLILNDLKFHCCTFLTYYIILKMSKFKTTKKERKKKTTYMIVTLQFLLWRQQQRQVPLRGHGDQGQLLDSGRRTTATTTTTTTTTTPPALSKSSNRCNLGKEKSSLFLFSF